MDGLTLLVPQSEVHYLLLKLSASAVPPLCFLKGFVSPLTLYLQEPHRGCTRIIAEASLVLEIFLFEAYDGLFSFHRRQSKVFPL